MTKKDIWKHVLRFYNIPIMTLIFIQLEIVSDLASITRPILVKLARAFDADVVLYNRSKAPNGLMFKPTVT